MDKTTELSDKPIEDVSEDSQREGSDTSESVNPKIKYYEPTPEMIEEAMRIVGSDTKALSEFFYNKFEREAKKHWDIFYKNNKDNFFKDRHYIEREFKEIREYKEKNEKFTLCEIGCGVGNALYPLLESCPNIICYGFDFSPRAIKLIEENEVTQKNKDRIFVEVVDIVKDPFPKHFPAPDLATLIFVLSAIAPEHFDAVAKKISDFLRPGSVLFFRDYGRFDMAQLKLASHKSAKLKDNFYVKSDGTRVYYFTKEEIAEIFTKAGFEVLENEYHYRLVENKKLELKMNRVWLQAKFVKKEIKAE